MKNFNLFLLTVSLLICSSYSFISFGVVGPFTAYAFTCLQSSVPDSIPYVIIRAYQNSESPSGVDTNALQTITNSFTAGYAADIYVEICRGINATSQINLVNSGVITPMMTNPSVYTNYLVYIKVEPSVNSACSWEAYTQQDNCNYLMEAANAVSNLGFWTPVVFSTSNIWSKFFGSNCENMALSTGALLSYADYETTGQVTSRQTFDDFLPFGGWSVGNGNIYIKQVGGNVTVPLLCSSTPWHAFVDQYWYWLFIAILSSIELINIHNILIIREPKMIIIIKLRSKL